MPTIRNFKNLGTLYSDVQSLYPEDTAPRTIPYTEWLPPCVAKKVDLMLTQWVLTQGHHFGILWEPELLAVFKYLLGPNWNPPNRNNLAGRGLEYVHGLVVAERDKVRSLRVH